MHQEIEKSIKSYYLPSPKIISNCLYNDKETIKKFQLCVNNIKYKATIILSVLSEKI